MMNNYKDNFKEELFDPKSVLKKTVELSDDIMKITDKNNANNAELYADIQKINRVVTRGSFQELSETNRYLTEKYLYLVENSNGRLRLVSEEIADTLTDENHIITLIIFAQLLYQSIQNNNYNAFMSKLGQTVYTATEHIGESALKAYFM